MKINELVKTMQSERPELFNGVRKADAAALVREAFSQVRKAIEGNEAGVIRINGLGAFRTVTTERELDGQKVQTRRVIFRAVSPRE